MKQEHKDYIIKNNINSVEELKKHLQHLSDYRHTLTKDGERMFRELSCLLYEDRESVLSFFADKVLEQGAAKNSEVLPSIDKVIKNCNIAQEKYLERVLEQREPQKMYVFSWRPSQKTENALNTKPVHSNPFVDNSYCTRKKRIEDVEREKEQSVFVKFNITQEDVKNAQKDWVNSIGRNYLNNTTEDFHDLIVNYTSQLAQKQKDKVTTEDLKVFKRPEVKDCTIKDGKVEYGVKEIEGKVNYEELDWDYIDGMANRMSKNLDKYPPKNWQKNMNIKKLAESAIRHARKILQEIDKDEETAQEHAYALGCNGMMINYQLKVKK